MLLTMREYLDLIWNTYSGYFNYLLHEITHWHWDNYFYGLIGLSLVVWGLEYLMPWRKNQALFREDFWLDTFYMFFNFFLLNLIVLMALSETAAHLFDQFLGFFGIQISSLMIFDLNVLPTGLGLLVFFLVTDFVQWNTHRLLHRVPWLWQFHQVHHSVKQMGFAAHLRYHWMEPVVYKSMLYVPIALIGGFNAQDVVLVHFFAIAIGHMNHANIGWDYGPLKYVLNNPKMHIWHHAKDLPKTAKYGINFGISLSLWDYLFGTAHTPYDGRDLELGFPGDDNFPKTFMAQEMHPWQKNS